MLYKYSMQQYIQPPLLIKYFILGILVCLGLYKTAETDWAGLFMVIQAFVWSLVPTFLKKFYGIRTPHLLQAGVAIFMFATIFLGESGGFYERFWWWDLIWHTLAGIAFGLVGYMILILTYRKQNVVLAPLFTSIFAVSFSLCISTLWELLEFSIDFFLHTTMQPSGQDTMTDLFVALIGASISAFNGYRYLQFSERLGMGGVIDEAITKNAHTTLQL